MSRSVSKSVSQAHWRSLIQEQAASGLSVAKFCEQRQIAVPTFYVWRSRLKQAGALASRSAMQSASFIDLGSMQDMPVSTCVTTQASPTALNVRLDLGGGLVLTIARP